VKNHEAGPVMKKSNFSEGQVVYIIRESESGTKLAWITFQRGIGQTAFLKYGEVGVTELKRWQAHVSDNGQLNKLVADLRLDNLKLQYI
jgi:hypothetical protein